MINNRKVIGIIGGMGPMATADLFKKIIELTDAEMDREHLHILIDNNTDIPDRTNAILSGSTKPLELMAESAERLTVQGADYIIIPCNTSHYFLDALQMRCSVQIISMPLETARFAKAEGFKRLGLLATDGTVKSGVYEKAFEGTGIELIVPDEEGQRKVMNMTYNEVKAGKTANTSALDGTLDSMQAQGAEAFILGCTELPIAFRSCTDRKFIDPTAILARAAIKAAGGKTKEL